MDAASLPVGSDEFLAEEEKKAYLENFIPFTIMMSFIFIVGTIGNVTVLVIYFIRYKPSTYRTCILTLAAIDLSSCVIDVPTYIAEERFSYTYRSGGACILFETFHFFILSFSYMMLSFIAIERYRRSCKPFAHQITLHESKVICLVLGISCVFISSPGIWIHGVVLVEVEGVNVTGYQCDVIDKSSTLTKGYYVLCLLLLLVSLVICGTMYSLVGRELIKRRNELKRHSPESKVIPSVEKETAGSSTTNSKIQCGPAEHVQDGNSAANEETSSHEVIDIESDQLDKSETTSIDHNNKITSTEDSSNIILTHQKLKPKGIIMKKQKKNKKKKKSMKLKMADDLRRKRYNKSVRITLMFLVASILSCLSAFPLLLLQTIEGISSSAMNYLEENILWLSVMLARFQLFNHISNPFVYCFMDTKFRSECVSLCKRFKHRVSEKCCGSDTPM
ncbi:cholecystokinin receptor type A-like [Argopecten irradians]|uniref:cholecystokinin receptor type A-like n=1 Tax=Argopecten irradians TaxID=31199 RepID=UPI003719061D